MPEILWCRILLLGQGHGGRNDVGAGMLTPKDITATPRQLFVKSWIMGRFATHERILPKYTLMDKMKNRKAEMLYTGFGHKSDVW